MALIIVEREEEIDKGEIDKEKIDKEENDKSEIDKEALNKSVEGDTGRVKYFDRAAQIQQEFCRLLELQKRRKEPSLFEYDCVKNYLESFGVTYRGNYKLYCEEWFPEEQFVTFLNYPLQWACLALYYHDTSPETKIVLRDHYPLDEKYSVPVLMEMDVYEIMDDYYFDFSWVLLGKLQESGVEIRIAGHSSKKFPERGSFFSFLLDVETGYTVFSKKLDKKVFEDMRGKLQIPYRASFGEYALKVQEEQRKSRFHCHAEEEQECFAKMLEEHPEYDKVTVSANEKIEGYRGSENFPVHWLFFIDGEWRYMDGNLSDSPAFLELIKEAALDPRPYDMDSGEYVDVSKAEKVFAMVLCGLHGRCEARKYWEHICCFVKYDRNRKELEICKRQSALPEFHELLQKSGDLHLNGQKDSWGGRALRRIERRSL